jgi:Zn-finger nucleic acid-binding protein
MYRTNAAWTCPRCGQRLIEDAPLHTCAGCGGAWMTETRLDAALHAHGVAGDAPPRRWLWWRRERLRCPVCDAPLGLVVAGGVHIDRCKEHGLWFDAGELMRLLVEAGVTDAQEAVTTAQLLKVLRGAISPPA